MAEETAAAGQAPGGEAPAKAAGTQVAPAAQGQTQQQRPAPAGSLFDFNDFGEKVMGSLKRGDLGFAMGLMLILVVLIMPMPSWLLDMSLAMSITLAVLILITVVFIAKAKIRTVGQI